MKGITDAVVSYWNGYTNLVSFYGSPTLSSFLCILRMQHQNALLRIIILYSVRVRTLLVLIANPLLSHDI